MRQENLRSKASLGYREKHHLNTTTTNEQQHEMYPNHLFWQCRSAMAAFLESGDPTARAPQLDSLLPTASFHLLFLNVSLLRSSLQQVAS